MSMDKFLERRWREVSTDEANLATDDLLIESEDS
jgi:hypothetical protein